MIVSHTHRFIFLKTSKTAGTSVEIALSEFCGDRDVITPVLPEDEALRRSLGHRGPQNRDIPMKRWGATEYARLVTKRRRPRFYGHMTAREAMRALGRGVWDSYFKFCFERNPWDRVISKFHWHFRDGDKPEFAEFVRSRHIDHLVKKGHDVYTIDGAVVVDRVCRYEQLLDELERVRTTIGLPEPLSLPRAKGGERADRRHYREVFDDESRDIVARKFAFEIELMGYEF